MSQSPSRKRMRLDDTTADSDGACLSNVSMSDVAPPVLENQAAQQTSAIPLLAIPIDPDGDLILRVGTELADIQPRHYRVCSATMRRASSVWKSMLFGPWSEARPTQGDWVVELPEDKPLPVRTLLAIAHGRFAKVPKEISLPDLYDIIVVADKYDLIHTLRPWARGWTTALWKCNLYSRDIGKFLVMSAYVSWELGCEDKLARDLKELNLHLSCTETGFSYKGEELKLDHHSGPPDMAEHLSKYRLWLIQKCLDLYNADIEGRMEGKRPSCERGNRVCDAAILVSGGISTQQNEDLFSLERPPSIPGAQTSLCTHC